MAAIQWANTVRCDWPDCPEQATVFLDGEWPRRHLADGWVDFSESLTLINMTGVRMTEFCPVHAQATVHDLAEVFTWRKVEAGT